MAVRVIKQEPAPEVLKQVICRSCGATLEYVPNDVKIVNGVDYSGGSDGHEYIECPNCKKTVVLRSW